jgi:hypothetical protein
MAPATASGLTSNYQALEKVEGIAEDLTCEVYPDTLIERSRASIISGRIGRAAALPPACGPERDHEPGSVRVDEEVGWQAAVRERRSAVDSTADW